MGDLRTRTPALEGEGLAPGPPGKSSQCGFHYAFVVIVGQIVILNFFWRIADLRCVSFMCTAR